MKPAIFVCIILILSACTTLHVKDKCLFYNRTDLDSTTHFSTAIELFSDTIYWIPNYYLMHRVDSMDGLNFVFKGYDHPPASPPFKLRREGKNVYACCTNVDFCKLRYRLEKRDTILEYNEYNVMDLDSEHLFSSGTNCYIKDTSIRIFNKKIKCYVCLIHEFAATWDNDYDTYFYRYIDYNTNLPVMIKAYRQLGLWFGKVKPRPIEWYYTEILDKINPRASSVPTNLGGPIRN